MPDDDVRPPLVVVMGVSGSGKTTVGRALAERLRVRFEDGDDLHPEANVAKMSRGEPLDDADRFPWLERVGEWLAAQEAADVGGVVACSALKRRYRDQLRGHASDLDLLLLTAEQDVLAARLRDRHGHFMPAGLLSSQLATLEPLQPDERGRVVDVDQPVGAIVEEYLREVEEDR